MKQAVVFEGGGFNGEASAHEWRRLWQSGFRPTLAGGESIGAVMAWLSMALSPDAIVQFWADHRKDQVFRGGGGLEKLLTAAGLSGSVFDMKPSLEYLSELTARYRLPGGAQVVVTTTNMRTGAMCRRVIERDTPSKLAARWIWRSCLVPFAHGIDGVWADGGVSASAPMAPVVKLGARDIHLILLDTPGTSEWQVRKNAVAQAGRAVTILRENLRYQDIQGTHLRNLIAADSHYLGYERVNATFHCLAAPPPEFMDLSDRARAMRRSAEFKTYPLEQYYRLLDGLKDSAERDAERDEVAA